MSYTDDHPTNFNWRPDVKGVVTRVQKKWPWKTYCNTYFCHPPGWCRDKTSFDVWGGGGTNADNYSGYRGKALDPVLGDKIFDFIFNDPDPPNIWWIIYKGRMWTRAGGWGPAPPGPADSDPGHWKHIHVTYVD